MNEEQQTAINPIIVVTTDNNNNNNNNNNDDEKRQRLIDKFLETNKWPIELEIDFIEALKKCPSLWAKQQQQNHSESSSFKNNPLLKTSQLEQLSLEFSGLSESQIISKIKLIKDNFTRIHKQIVAIQQQQSSTNNSNDGDNNENQIENKIKQLKSKWNHYERCEFLAEHVKHRNRQSSSSKSDTTTIILSSSDHNSHDVVTGNNSNNNNMVSWFTSSMTYPERWQGAEDLPFVKFQPTEKMRQQKNNTNNGSTIKQQQQRSRLMQRQKEMAECYMDVDSLVKTLEKQEESLLKREQMLKMEREKLSMNPLFNYIMGKDHVLKKIHPQKIDDLKFELDGVIDRYAREYPK